MRELIFPKSNHKKKVRDKNLKCLQFRHADDVSEKKNKSNNDNKECRMHP